MQDLEEKKNTAESNTCKYCKKTFAKLSTLSVHACEGKRRANQENDKGVQLGLHAYNRFIELTQGSGRQKTYVEFCNTPYYSAFVKFGQYLISIRAVETTKFVDWLIKGNKKLDEWTKDKYYDEYLCQYLRIENPQDAVARSIKEMAAWSDESKEPFNHFFFKCSANRVCQLINNGRISPWLVFNSESGVEFLNKLSLEQLQIIYMVVEPDYWQVRFKKYKEDADWVKLISKEAGL